MLDHNKQQILTKTLNHLNQQMTGMDRPAFQVKDTASGKDHVVLMQNNVRSVACIQAWAPQQNFSALLQRLRAMHAGLLLADFINPVMAEKLKQQAIHFVDKAGNMYLGSLGDGVFVKGNKNPRLLHQVQKGRVFNPTGIRLLYAFLNSPALLNASYRVIAKKVGVALGSIGPVMANLQHAGYLYDQAKQKKLINKKRLFERWVDAYLEKLRPKQFIGRYQSTKPDWWKAFDVTHFEAQWGGEIVIARQTPFMLPENTSVYMQMDDMDDFLQASQLQMDADGDVTLYRAFWLNKETGQNVNSMIVYADLLDSVDPANWEVAKTFYGEAITDFLQE